LWSCAATQLHEERDRRNVVAFFFFFFVQCKKKRKKKAILAVVAFFFLLWSYVTAQLHKEGDGSYRRLLLPLLELRYSGAP
jgi:hypothetical protein